MSVHKKLMQARIELQGTQLKKSGLNKFAGYSYFELGDFLPTIQAIFNRLGLCGVVSYSIEYATLTITDTEDGTVIVITSPMAEANLKGTHPIQNLGAVETYSRRYLWMTAMEIVEHDILDASTGYEEGPKEKPAATKPAAKAPTKVEGKDTEWQLKVVAKPDGDHGEWSQLIIDATMLQIAQAKTEADVMNIFKTNRNIYDEVKAGSPTAYDVLMAEFKQARATHKKD
jgi:hypothetical protein